MASIEPITIRLSRNKRALRFSEPDDGSIMKPASIKGGRLAYPKSAYEGKGL
jgi:hypothetical protein